VDELATAYSRARPGVLLPRLRKHLGYVRRLLDVRKTLEQHRRLLVVGGWLQLLSATVHIVLRQRRAATIELATPRQVADHAGHHEIAAWCVETTALDDLTEGDYSRAAELSRQAQAVAPRGSSVFIQAIARGLGAGAIDRRRETLDALVC